MCENISVRKKLTKELEMTNREIEALNKIKVELATAWFEIDVDNDTSSEFNKATNDIYAIIYDAISAECRRRKDNKQG